MNVTVRLYNNYSDPNVVHKNISQVAAYSCQVTSSCSLDSPEILLNLSGSLPTFNYINIVNGNQMLISGNTDVLMSFWDSFRNSQCVAQRSSSAQNPEIEDELMPFKAQPRYIYRRSGFAFTPTSSGGCYILTVGGK